MYHPPPLPPAHSITRAATYIPTFIIVVYQVDFLLSTSLESIGEYLLPVSLKGNTTTFYHYHHIHLHLLLQPKRVSSGSCCFVGHLLFII